jgi:aminoglycoside phosphotransferase (APT) family kinase protein
MENLIDSPGKVRDSEQLNVNVLENYLSKNIPEIKPPIEIQQFRSGHSNLTYLIRSGGNEFILRMPPPGAHKIKKGHNMFREYRVMRDLYPHFNKVPRTYLYCDVPEIIGAEFYIMERVKGVILRTTNIDKFHISEETMHNIAENFIQNYVQIHNLDYMSIGLADFGNPQGYVKRQIEGWAERYRNAKTDDIPAIEKVIVWLSERIPQESGASLIHNDFRYDNIVLNPDDLSQIKAILDWEMATIGDPLMDLGTTLGYWVDPDDPDEVQFMKVCPTTQPGNYTREELVQRYAELSGRDVSNILFYFVYGLFKIAVIAQQIYYRYKLGYTKDERFSALLYAVQTLSKMAVLAIEKNRITKVQ